MLGFQIIRRFFAHLEIGLTENAFYIGQELDKMTWPWPH